MCLQFRLGHLALYGMVVHIKWGVVRGVLGNTEISQLFNLRVPAFTGFLAFLSLF